MEAAVRASRASGRTGIRPRQCRSRGARCSYLRKDPRGRAPDGRRAANTAPACWRGRCLRRRARRYARVSKFVPPSRSIFPSALQLRQPSGRLDRAGHVVIPPVELHEIEPVGRGAASARCRRSCAILARSTSRSFSRSGTHLVWTLIRAPALRAISPCDLGAEFADQLLDAGIDVGAVESGDAGLEERHEVLDGGRAVDGAVAAGELPAAAYDAGDLVAGAKRDRGYRLHRRSPKAARR